MTLVIHTDVLVALAMWPMFRSWAPRLWGASPVARGPLAAFMAASVALFALHDYRLIPDWLTWVGVGLLVVGFAFAPRDDDDDDHRPRRRLRSALKRARTWLATGVPARRAVEG